MKYIQATTKILIFIKVFKVFIFLSSHAVPFVKLCLVRSETNLNLWKII